MREEKVTRRPPAQKRENCLIERFGSLGFGTKRGREEGGGGVVDMVVNEGDPMRVVDVWVV